MKNYRVGRGITGVRFEAALADLHVKNLLPPALSDLRLSIVRAIDPRITSIGTKDFTAGMPYQLIKDRIV